MSCEGFLFRQTGNVQWNLKMSGDGSMVRRSKWVLSRIWEFSAIPANISAIPTDCRWVRNHALSTFSAMPAILVLPANTNSARIADSSPEMPELPRIPRSWICMVKMSGEAQNHFVYSEWLKSVRDGLCQSEIPFVSWTAGISVRIVTFSVFDIILLSVKMAGEFLLLDSTYIDKCHYLEKVQYSALLALICKLLSKQRTLQIILLMINVPRVFIMLFCLHLAVFIFLHALSAFSCVNQTSPLALHYYTVRNF